MGPGRIGGGVVGQKEAKRQLLWQQQLDVTIAAISKLRRDGDGNTEP